ncbi:phosphodiester glycosidase family protein [Halobacillus sp. HZG1]|uniref:phosphodiester glycosidase family protein n=1 Tax=Halobacillus sp. HZG1 TaxID=3111769 RepID=UPI002DBA9958|nr:phosphodiester glycosidase family protein [Halobacillus sp. HZG1]MEC3885688.1 phosphodiester glycosidase family protein [Halobacillus sp. HZG1]
MTYKPFLSTMLAASLLMPTTTVLAKEQQSSDTPVTETTSSDSLKVLHPVIHEEKETTPIALGLTLTQIDRFDVAGWLRADVLKANLSENTLSTDLLTPGSVTEKAPISDQMRESGAIAGVNGDFFDISNTNAPIGTMVKDGELLKSGDGRTHASVSNEGIGSIANALLEGKIQTEAGSWKLDGINQPTVYVNEMVMYTSAWGEADRSHMMNGSDHYTEVLIKVQRVVEVLSNQVYSKPLEQDETLIVGKGEEAFPLKELAAEDQVQVSYSTLPAYQDMNFAVGGSTQLLKDGEINTSDHGDRHPRTAVGFSEDGKEMVLVTIDGRQADSRGMTMLELAHFMKEQGAYNALNLDGGGSSTLVARELGKDKLNVFNSPSDGSERAVPNGVGIYSAAATGNLDGFNIETNSTRVLQGFSRVFQASGYDTAYAPVDINQNDVKWQGGNAGSFDGNIFTAKHAGEDQIRAKYRGDDTYKDIQVLGEPVELAIEPSQIGMEKGETTTFTVKGKDEEGYETYVEPTDVQLTYDEDQLEISPNKDGSFTIKGLVDSGASIVKAEAGELSTNLGITIGLKTEMAETFDNESNPWTVFKYPASVGAELNYIDNELTDGNALKLDYDFTTTTRTRAAYMFPPNRRLEMDGDVKKIGVNVYGTEGNGHWLRARVKDSNNVYHTLNLDYSVDWDGWKYVEAEVPNGVEYPLVLDRIYLVETDRNKQDKGSIIIDDIQAKVAQKLDMPEEEKTEDPLILDYGQLPEEDWQFAVISDMQLISANKDSKEIQNSEEVLQAVNEQDVDFVLFNGDIVDFDTDEEYQFAKDLIEDNLDKPYYVSPGNHEVYGSGNLDNFKEYFGPDHQVFDHKGTRFIQINTSKGGLRISNAEQWFMIKSALDEAEKDPSINNVFVYGHHPLEDPLPDAAHALSDQKEADLLEGWLTEFREDSGKPAMVMSAHASLVNLDRRDGIPYMITGPIGKGTYGAPDDGGFFNYAVMSIDPDFQPDHRLHHPSYQGLEKNPWIQADIRPILQDMTVEKASYPLNETVEVELTGHQSAGWEFPLDYPATIRYEGSDNLLISEEGENNTDATAVFNREDQTITFLKDGKVSLTVQAGDYKETFEFTAE